MRWQDEGVIIGSKIFGESSVILDVFTKEHGMHRGLVRGGTSKGKKPILQIGNLVHVTWNSRLESQLGSYSVEAQNYYSINLIQNPIVSCGFDTMRYHLSFVAERIPHPKSYYMLVKYLSINYENITSYYQYAEYLFRFEYYILEELGLGLDLRSCAATGVKENLCYVSPRSWQAVSKDAGKPWHDKLLPLPKYLLSKDTRIETVKDITDSYKLFSVILEKHLWQPSGKSPNLTRERFLDSIVARLNIG